MEPIWNEMYDAAKAVLHPRRISEYVTCGEVAAAILSKSGKIYTGVCMDTCCTLGICAERNAIFNMLTNGEQEIHKVLVVCDDGTNGAPCGACRELMVTATRTSKSWWITPSDALSGSATSRPNGGYRESRILSKTDFHRLSPSRSGFRGKFIQSHPDHCHRCRHFTGEGKIATCLVFHQQGKPFFGLFYPDDFRSAPSP